MIQRIQSVFLLVITVISLTIVNSDSPFYVEKSGDIEIAVDYNSTEVTGNEEPFSGQNTGLVYFLYVIGILSFIAIFLYKNRKLQMRLIMALLVLICLVLVNMYWYSFHMDYNKNAQTTLKLMALVPISMLLLGFLAFRGVQKDEKLVRSLDRIR